MAMYWNHLRDFVLLNLGGPRPQRGNARSRLIMSMPSPLPASSEAPWHDSYEESAIGYEASWSAIFQNPGT